MSTLRPWPPTGLSSADWRQIPPEPVRIADLRFAQDGVFVEGVKKLLRGGLPFGGDRYIHVVAYGGFLFIEDGTTRTVIAMCRGEDIIHARIYRPDR